MSELNKKSNLLVKVVLIYTLLAITITIASMWFYQKNGTSIVSHISKKYTNQTDKIENYIISESLDNNVEEDEEPVEIQRLSLTDKYYMNNIKFETVTINKGNIIDYDFEGNPIYKLTVEYCQISGLKNSIVEDKINKTIKERVEALIVDEEIYDNSLDQITIRAVDPMANFNDVLSISVYKTMGLETEEGYEYKHSNDGLNFRLDTGEELALQDLFTRDASIKNLLSQSYYKTLAFEYGLNDMENESWDLDKVDYGKIENEVFNFISKFNNQEEHKFYFSYNNVFVYVDEKACGIELQSYPEYVAIYNLVNQSESLYVNGNLEKKNYVLGPNYFENTEYFAKVGNDSFLSIYNYYRNDGTLEDQYAEYTNDLTRNIDKIIEAIENDTKKEPGKGYIYNINSYYVESETYLEFFSGEKAEVDLENFDENIDEIYAMAAKAQTGGEFMLSLYNVAEEAQKNGNSIYDMNMKDVDGDGEFEIGQKLITPDDWEGYFNAEYEY